MEIRWGEIHYFKVVRESRNVAAPYFDDLEP